MKFESTNTSSILFSEQVSKVISLFQEWNDCERSVSLYAILKRIPFSCTKFLQSVIDTNLTQAYCLEQTNLLEHNANSATFIRSLSETYKNFKCTDLVQLNKDSIFFESDICGGGNGGICGGGNVGVGGSLGGICGGSGSLNDIADKYYDRKEDILNDILTLMPILTPGNDEAKCAYLEFIPMSVEDAIRGTVNTSLVQQIFSYLLIHPAFTNDDRRSLSKLLRHLEDHIISNDPNFIIYPNGPSPTSEPANSTKGSSTNWQAIAPPQSRSTETIISWDSQHHLSSNGSAGGGVGGGVVATTVGVGGLTNSSGGGPSSFVVDDEYRCNGGNNKTLGSIIDFKSAPGSSPKLGHLYESNSDDHHISFSKNGTEILDFDCDDTDKSNTQIGFDTLANLNEFLTVPGIIDNITLKTRRSNSLTTTGSLQTACTTSAQNLNSIVQKPRSFSLSMVSPRSSLTSSGSDTRLDDFKPNYTKFTPHNVGMSNIGQWLKSLRLHKYVWIFSNITYDQMLDITEEYLQNLNVTKGARHKLVVCILKLKERHMLLCQLEKDLLANKVTLVGALDELTSIVLTPMKPVEPFNKHDIGGQFLKVLNLVSTMMTSKHILPQDEEPVNNLLWILEKAVHNEAFVAHTNQLKEHRFKVSRIKIQFPPKSHYGKSGTTSSTSSGGITRARSLLRTSSYNLGISRASSVDSAYDSLKSNSSESVDSFGKSSIIQPELNNTEHISFEKCFAHDIQSPAKLGRTSSMLNLGPFNVPPPPIPLKKPYAISKWVMPRSEHLNGHAESQRFRSPLAAGSFTPIAAQTLTDSSTTPETRNANEQTTPIYDTTPKFKTTYCDFITSGPCVPKAGRTVETPELINFYGSNKSQDTSTIEQLVELFKASPTRLTADAPEFISPLLTTTVTPPTMNTPPTATLAKTTSNFNTPRIQYCDIVSQSPNPRKTLTQFDKPMPPIQFDKINFGASLSNIFEPKAFDFSPPILNKSFVQKTRHVSTTSPKVSPGMGSIPSAVTNSMGIGASFNWQSPFNSMRNHTGENPPRSSNVGTSDGQGPSEGLADNTGQIQSQNMNYAQVATQNTGMLNMPAWLKSLRLHKYNWVFENMSYDRMLTVTEEYLESLLITKGARNKLSISIRKLNERFTLLSSIEKDFLDDACPIVVAMDELQAIVMTPMKPAQSNVPEDVASQFLKVLNLVFNRIIALRLPRSDEQVINKFLWLLEKAYYNEGLACHTTHLRKMRMRVVEKKNFW